MIDFRFAEMNEADVREEIIAPLLRRLGYRSGTENNVIREQSLRYPRFFLGRKDTKKDPELRGKADYILEVDGKWRWVIEAKSATSEITVDDVEQAWTYASHAEVRALYFVLCNGRSLLLHRTASSPQSSPILTFTYERLDVDFHVLSNVLSPASLKRDFPHIDPDLGIPIAPGLRSVARIAGGIIQYSSSSLPVPALIELQSWIRDGAIERSEDDKLVAFLDVVGPSRTIQELNEKLGFSSFEMVSDDSELSTDPSRPTEFTYANQLFLPAGSAAFDISSGRHLSLPQNMTCEVVAKANGVYTDLHFCGTFEVRMHLVEHRLDVVMSGSFEMQLA